MTYTPTIVSRADWGARPPTGDLGPVPGQHSAYMVAHHQGLDPAKPGYDRAVEAVLADEAGTVRAIQRQHQGNGSLDIEYNWLVGPSGSIYEGRGWRRNAANGTDSPGFPFAADVTNVNSRSFCLLGHGGDGRCFTPDAQLALAWLATQHVAIYQDGRNIGHRQIVATACPGDLYFDWWTNGASIAIDDDGNPVPPALPEVSPMYDPALAVAPLVADCPGPHGQGALVLCADWGVLFLGNPPVKPAGPNELISLAGRPDVTDGRQPARIEVNDESGQWTCVATNGDRYTFPTPA